MFLLQGWLEVFYCTVTPDTVKRAILPFKSSSKRMAQHYSVKDLLRQTPNALLARYFVVWLADSAEWVAGDLRLARFSEHQRPLNLRCSCPIEGIRKGRYEFIFEI